METIAFSAKSLDWKTRYSFTPLAYAKSNNKFISFTKPDGSIADTSGVHLHDSSQQYNTFYGTNYKSSISVVTNNDPSATKIFEAFSVEGSKGDWSAKFRTSTGEEQYSSFPANTMIEKEGKHYIDIPKNTLNKDMMLSYVGETTLFDLENASIQGNSLNKIKLKSKIHAIPGRALAFSASKYPEEFFEGDLYYNGTSVNDSLYRYHFSGEITDFTTEDNPASAPWIFFSPSWEYDPYTNSIEHIPISSGFIELSQEEVEQAIESGISQGAQKFSFWHKELIEAMTGGSYAGQILTQNNTSTLEASALGDVTVSIYSISDVESNGEDMRGEYMNVDIERSGTDYYELYAINVDQHKTKLDHSLGQNN